VEASDGPVRVSEQRAEFRGRFADNDRCREYLARLKWPEGFRCAHCAGDRAYFLPSKRVVYECAGCGRLAPDGSRSHGTRTHQPGGEPFGTKAQPVIDTIAPIDLGDQSFLDAVPTGARLRANIGTSIGNAHSICAAAAI
jgi:hypothetical protein